MSVYLLDTLLNHTTLVSDLIYLINKSAQNWHMKKSAYWPLNIFFLIILVIKIYQIFYMQNIAAFKQFVIAFRFTVFIVIIPGNLNILDITI
jgi:hypothetical protein